MELTKRLSIAAIAGAIALGAGLGLSYRADAQEPTGTAAPTDAVPVGVMQGDHGPGRWLEGMHEAYDAALAEALGVSVEALDVARQSARAAMLAEAVAHGRITQERADLMAARAALREAVDERAIIAQALGMTTEALDAALDEGQRLPALIEAAGLTRAEFRAAMATAFEAVVDAAVADGTLTQAQGDALKEEGMRGGSGPGRRGLRGGPHFHFHGEGDAPTVAPESGP